MSCQLLELEPSVEPIAARGRNAAGACRGPSKNVADAEIQIGAVGISPVLFDIFSKEANSAKKLNEAAVADSPGRRHPSSCCMPRAYRCAVFTAPLVSVTVIWGMRWACDRRTKQRP